MTTALSIEALGLTKDEIVDRLVSRIADQMIPAFGDTLEKKVLERVDRAIEEIAGKHVLPNVASYVENLCLQETTRWGEKVGEPVTFIEYLVKRAEDYLTEQVNLDGKTKAEEGFGWHGRQTRISYLVHKHLHYSIETAMKEAVKNANATIVQGLEETVRIKLGEIAQALKVKVETR